LVAATELSWFGDGNRPPEFDTFRVPIA
jgi:hypothetical protein